MQEVTENVEVAVSNNMYVSVCGNLSVANGFIDFYVTNPSESIILYYKKTSFSCFNFSATENGTYVLHLANIELENDVLATLNYGVKFEIILQATSSDMAYCCGVANNANNAYAFHRYSGDS